MSFAYLRELCLDYERQSFDPITRIPFNMIDPITKLDIAMGIEHLIATEQITIHHIRCFKLYVFGYTIAKIAYVYPNAQELLIQFFSLLSDTIQYTDEHIIQIALSHNPKKYTPTINAYRNKLDAYAREFV